MQKRNVGIPMSAEKAGLNVHQTRNDWRDSRNIPKNSTDFFDFLCAGIHKIVVGNALFSRRRRVDCFFRTFSGDCYAIDRGTTRFLHHFTKGEFL